MNIIQMSIIESIFILFAGLISAAFVVYILFYIQKRQDIKMCEEIIKKNSFTFYKAFSKIKNKQKRDAIYAVYAFCRYADDLVDEEQNKEALIDLEDELTLFKNGYKINHFRWRALRYTTKPFYGPSYDYKPFYDMIEGQKRDLNHMGYDTLEELLKYCYLVAGTVGLMLVPILSRKNSKELEKFAIDLGYAMQITNILRDVGEDYRNHRIYLPKDMLKNANYSIDDLAHDIINNEFKNLFEELAKIAEDNFDLALSKINLFPDDSRLPLALSIILYREILNSCRENGYDVFTKKNFVSDERKNQLIQKYLNSIRGV